MWKEDMFDVRVIDCQSQVVHFEVKDIAYDSPFCLSIVYGLNTRIQRKNLWSNQVTGPVHLG